MKKVYLALFLFLAAINNFAQKKFNGTFSNGYKGTKINFQISKDGKTIENLTFNGYWRCGSSTEKIMAGPEKPIPLIKGSFKAIMSDPENGGASAFRFDVNGITKGNNAEGTFRMSITGLSCDTYLLQWTATAQ